MRIQNTYLLLVILLIITSCNESRTTPVTATDTGIEMDRSGSNFPEDFLGTYKGTLEITAPSGKQEVPMTFKMQATETLDLFTYTIIYGDTEPRLYNLKRTSDPNLFMIDENNGIILQGSYANQTLYSTYEVQGNLLNSTEIFYQDRMEFMIALSKVNDSTTTGDSSSAIVKNYPVTIMQRATLYKE